jgi:hypothetical protein
MQFGRTRAAADAGRSERQRNTALRVANVPHDDFERQTESDAPLTITQLPRRERPRRRRSSICRGAIRPTSRQARRNDASCDSRGRGVSKVDRSGALTVAGFYVRCREFPWGVGQGWGLKKISRLAGAKGGREPAPVLTVRRFAGW